MRAGAGSMQSMGFEPRILGRTGLRVGPLGVAASYGVPPSAVERAFEQGVNYLYWGSMRRSGFAEAIRNLASRRDRLVVVLQSYSRIAPLLGWSLERGLRSLRLEFADVLLLGIWNRPVPDRILDACRGLRERGLARFLAVSSHNRRLVPELGQTPLSTSFISGTTPLIRAPRRTSFRAWPKKDVREPYPSRPLVGANS
jgi:aryl-alcohol dehydrogenase-like predicted oxidoreductase